MSSALLVLWCALGIHAAHGITAAPGDPPFPPREARLELEEPGRWAVCFEAPMGASKERLPVRYLLERASAENAADRGERSWRRLAELDAANRTRFRCSVPDALGAGEVCALVRLVPLGAGGERGEAIELIAPRLEAVDELQYREETQRFLLGLRGLDRYLEVEAYGRYRWAGPRPPFTPTGKGAGIEMGVQTRCSSHDRGQSLQLEWETPDERGSRVLEFPGPTTFELFRPPHEPRHELLVLSSTTREHALYSHRGELRRRWSGSIAGRELRHPIACCQLGLRRRELAVLDAATGEIVCFEPYAPEASDDPLPLVKDGVFAHPVWYEEPALQPKVLVLNFDPLVDDGAGGELRLSKHAGWNDPRTLAEEFRRDLYSASGGYVKHRIVEWRDLDIHPPKVDGFAYDDASYLAAKGAGKWHDPDRLDYAKLVEQHDLAGLVATGAIDEVWLFGGPAFGFYETQMVGPKAYWCNSPGLDVEEAERLFVIFGFNYERGVAEMIHDLGHMTESILAHVYEPLVGKWRAEERRSAWELFSAYDAKHPGLGAVGNCHFPVNGEKDYDYANPREVLSSAADWKLWPLRPAEPRAIQRVSRETWGGPDYHRSYQRWFFAHLPRRAGRAPDGRLANWWEYLFHPNAHAESRGR